MVDGSRVNEVMSNVVEGTKPYMEQVTKIGIAVVILLVGFGLGVLVKKFLYKFLKEIELNKILNRIGITRDLEKWVSSIASYVIYLFTIIIFLDQLGVRSYALWILIGAVLLLLILTFLVGLKDVIPNFVAWIVLQRKGKIKEGMRVDVREIAGRVEKVGYLETEIKTDQDDILYVPNSLFLKSKFKIKND